MKYSRSVTIVRLSFKNGSQGVPQRRALNVRPLSEEATTEDYSVVRLKGKRKVNRRVKHYNLDAIISVGYRVNSKQGTQFRIWANKVLREVLAGNRRNFRPRITHTYF